MDDENGDHSSDAHQNKLNKTMSPRKEIFKHSNLSGKLNLFNPAASTIHSNKRSFQRKMFKSTVKSRGVKSVDPYYRKPPRMDYGSPKVNLMP